jgi:2-polyprenyl-6-methoxyphenol hydroxylase-like FAD-dependent oxidoreductase
MATPRPRATIIGAGIAGLSTALALERAGIGSTIVERAPGPRGAGYMLDFFGVGLDAAERMGMAEDVAGIHYPIDSIVFVDGAGRPQLSIAYPVLRSRVFGDRHFNFLRGDLEDILAGRVASAELAYGRRPVWFTQDGELVRTVLDDGRALESDLLVGADGIHSWVRAEAFGPEERFRRPLHHVVAAYVIEDRIETGFGGSFVTLTVPGRMVAVYPIRGGRTATFFCRRGEPGDEAPGDGLRGAFGDLGWIVPEILERMPPDDEIFVDRVDQVVVDRWHRRRIVLVGDAAWCTTLLAGQGASLAVAGGEALGTAIAASSGDIADALGRYETGLRDRVDAAQAAGRRMADWFVPESSWRLTVRRLALRLAVTPVLSTVIGRAMGTRAAT